MPIKDKLLLLYDMLPFHEHPLWVAVIKGELTFEQVIRAEIQHCIRTAAGQQLRRLAVTEAQSVSPTVFAAVLETYLEECTSRPESPSHLELIERLVLAGGVTEAQIRAASPTPGNSAAMALYKEIGSRGAACHILGAGAVEFYYSTLSPKIFKAYTELYGMSEHSAATYKLHGPMDQVHATRALEIADEAVKIHGWEVVEQSVKDAFVATSLHYDGMLQAATSKLAYWGGTVK